MLATEPTFRQKSVNASRNVQLYHPPNNDGSASFISTATQRALDGALSGTPARITVRDEFVHLLLSAQSSPLSLLPADNE